MPTAVKIYADGRENLRRRPSLFSPVLIQQRPDLCWEATVRAEALGLEGALTPSSPIEIKTRFDMLGMAINTYICPVVTNLTNRNIAYVRTQR